MPSFPHNPNPLRDRKLCVFVNLESPTFGDEQHLKTLCKAHHGKFEGFINGKLTFQFESMESKLAFDKEAKEYIKSRDNE